MPEGRDDDKIWPDEGQKLESYHNLYIRLEAHNTWYK